MSGLRELLARAAAFFRGTPVDTFESEIEAHREFLIAEYLRRGLAPEDARNAAHRELGNVSLIREQYREQRGLPLLASIWQDGRYALRTLGRAPSFTAACVATLAVGLAGMIAVFCVLSALVLQPLPYDRPDRLVYLQESDPRGGAWPLSEPTLLDVEQRAKTISGIAAFRQEKHAITGWGEPESIETATVNAAFFSVWGITPIRGRTFERTGGASPASEVILSRALWKRKWQMDPQAVGRSIAIDGQPYTIAGIADVPADLLNGVEMYLPLSNRLEMSRSAHDVSTVARLQDPFTREQAQAELSALAAMLGRTYAISNAGWDLRIVPLFDYVVGPQIVRTLWMLLGAVGLVWLLACANIAGLLVARGVARSQETSTRLAVGATRLRLLRQSLVESAVLAAGGSVGGLLLAQWIVAAIRSFGADRFPRLAGVHIDGTAAAVALACVILSTLLFGTFPGWAATRGDNRLALLHGGRGITRRSVGRDVLIVAQVALASVLVLGATLLLQSFLRLQTVDPGFNPDQLLTVRLNMAGPKYDAVRKEIFLHNGEAALALLPGIKSAGATNVAPYSGMNTANRFRLEGESVSGEYRTAAWRSVTPGFFGAMGIPLKSGRLFGETDRNGSVEVVILSESMANRFWPGQNPLGKRLLWGRSGNPKTIVGIVGDARDVSVDSEPRPTMYRPYPQLTDPSMAFIVRTNRKPQDVASEIRRSLWRVEPDVPLAIGSLRTAMSGSITRPRASAFSVGAFAFSAIVIAGFGLYGLLSYRVNQRHQEIGIRLALGAPARSVQWDVQRRSLALVMWGLAAGLPLGWLLSRWMSSLLYRTAPTQISAYAAVFAVFGTVALAASYAPARRAARTDPANTLRHE